MGDRIVFLGTGGDAIVVGKQYRASGGIIIESGESQIHIDPGPATLAMARMYDVNLRENTAILVSHNHINHANDANAVISAMTHNGMDKKGVLISSKSTLRGDEKEIPFINHFYRDCVEKYIMVEKYSKIGIRDIDIICTPTKHSDPSTVGFMLSCHGYTMGYTSDTDYSDDLAEAFKGTDILIMNVPYPRGIADEHNLNSEDAAKLIDRVRPKLAVITHFGVKMLQADPLYEAREIQKATKVQTLCAKDGLVINPVSFSSSVKQKDLKSY